MTEMPTKMKLWEVVAAFGMAEMLAVVKRREDWRDLYLQHLHDWSVLCNNFRRDILDSLVPLELTREIASRCDRPFYYNPQTRYLRTSLHENSEVLYPDERFRGTRSFWRINS